MNFSAALALSGGGRQSMSAANHGAQSRGAPANMETIAEQLTRVGRIFGAMLGANRAQLSLEQREALEESRAFDDLHTEIVVDVPTAWPTSSRDLVTGPFAETCQPFALL